MAGHTWIRDRKYGMVMVLPSGTTAAERAHEVGRRIHIDKKMGGGAGQTLAILMKRPSNFWYLPLQQSVRVASTLIRSLVGHSWIWVRKYSTVIHESLTDRLPHL